MPDAELLSISKTGELAIPLAWADDGKALFVIGSGRPPWTVERLDLSTGTRTPWTTITPSETAGLRSSVFAMTSNGSYWSVGNANLLTDLYLVAGDVPGSVER